MIKEEPMKREFPSLLEDYLTELFCKLLLYFSWLSFAMFLFWSFMYQTGYLFWCYEL